MSAIHHLLTDEKRRLYQRVHALLAPSGCFVNVDEMKAPTREAYLDDMLHWVHHVESAAKDLPEHLVPAYQQWNAHFDRWRARNIQEIDRPRVKGDDLHEEYAVQLGWLRDAGFVHVDLIAKVHLWCAIAGRKPQANE